MTAPQHHGRMTGAQRVVAGIVTVITVVLAVESYGSMIQVAREGGRHLPGLWPLGTEALALAMEVSVLEAKRQEQKLVMAVSWALLLASVALSTILQVIAAPNSWEGYLTAGATPVWMLGSFTVLSLLYHAKPRPAPAPAATPEQPQAEEQPPPPPPPAKPAPSRPSASKRTTLEEARAARERLRAKGREVSGATLAELLGCDGSTGRRWLRKLQQADEEAAAEADGRLAHLDRRASQ